MSDEQPNMDEVFQEAMANSQTKEYNHTAIETLILTVDDWVEGTDNPITAPLVDYILRSYPFLGVGDIKGVIESRREYLQEVRNSLTEILDAQSKTHEEIFAEISDDWNLHKEMYKDLIVKWTVMTTRWSKDWSDLFSLNADSSSLANMVALTEISSMIIGRTGIIEIIRGLSGFDLVQEDYDKLNERAREDYERVIQEANGE